MSRCQKQTKLGIKIKKKPKATGEESLKWSYFHNCWCQQKPVTFSESYKLHLWSLFCQNIRRRMWQKATLNSSLLLSGIVQYCWAEPRRRFAAKNAADPGVSVKVKVPGKKFRWTFLEKTSHLTSGPILCYLKPPSDMPITFHFPLISMVALTIGNVTLPLRHLA